MAFTAADVKKLREMTNVGMMDCKKALTENDGDMDKAVEWLREKGLAKAAKKASRIAAEGMAYATVCDKCGVGAMVEVNCETDFCAKFFDKFFVKLRIKLPCGNGELRLADNNKKLRYAGDLREQLTAAFHLCRAAEYAERHVAANLCAKLAERRDGQRLTIVAV